MTNWMQQ